jgi:hypothetical protein
MTAEAPSAEEGAALAARYGLEFGEPEWWPDLVARHGLSPAAPGQR